MGTCCATVKPTVTPVKFSTSFKGVTKYNHPENLELLDSSWQVLRGQSATEKENPGQEKSFFINSAKSQDFFKDLGLSISSKKGLKSFPFNQDDYSVIFNKETLFISVFDGHGVHGNEISNYLHIVLPNLILTHPSFPSEIESVLRESFFKCNTYLHQYCESIQIKTELSGSTCTIIIIHNHTMHICNIGDSKAIISDTKGNIYKLTVDHKPCNPKEMERVIKSGGEVKKSESESIYRIFIQNLRMPGISVSRAFGDSIAQTIGVTVDPDISKRDISEDDLFLMVCSDGVWEFLTEPNAVDIVTAAQHPGAELAEKAWDKWIEIEVNAADDITAVVLNLKQYFELLNELKSVE